VVAAAFNNDPPHVRRGEDVVAGQLQPHLLRQVLVE